MQRKIGETGTGQADALPGKKFKVAVRSHMHHDIRPETVLKPAVGRYIMMWRRHGGIMQYFADLPVTPGAGASALGLDANHGIAPTDAGNEDIPVEHHCGGDTVHRFPRRIAPCLRNLLPDIFRVGIEPSPIGCEIHMGEYPALGLNFLHRRPTEFGNRLALHDGFDERRTGLGDIHGISGLPHGPEDTAHRLQRIQLGGSAYGCLHGRAGITVQKKGDPAFRHGLISETQPAGDAGGETLHPFGMGRTALDFGSAHAGLGQGAATEEKRLNGSFKFGHGDGPRHFAVQTLRIGFPFLKCF